MLKITDGRVEEEPPGRRLDKVNGNQARERHSQQVEVNANGGLAIPAPPHAPEAPLVVQPSLFTFGPMEPTVPQFAQDARPLHRRLEPLEEALPIFSFSKRHVRQTKSLFLVFLSRGYLRLKPVQA